MAVEKVTEHSRPCSICGGTMYLTRYKRGLDDRYYASYDCADCLSSETVMHRMDIRVSSRDVESVRELDPGEEIVYKR